MSSKKKKKRRIKQRKEGAVVEQVTEPQVEYMYPVGEGEQDAPDSLPGEETTSVDELLKPYSLEEVEDMNVLGASVTTNERGEDTLMVLVYDDDLEELDQLVVEAAPLDALAFTERITAHYRYDVPQLHSVGERVSREFLRSPLNFVTLGYHSFGQYVTGLAVSAESGEPPFVLVQSRDRQLIAQLRARVTRYDSSLSTVFA